MPPVKVLDLRDTNEIGGPGKTIIETYRAIDPQRFELHLGVFLRRHASEDTPFVNAARACGMPVHFIRGMNPYDPRMILRVVELVETLGIDVVHAHEPLSDIITYLARTIRRMLIVSTAHGWYGDGLKARLLIALDKRVLRRFDRVIAVSTRIHDDLKAASVPAETLRLLHNGIVTERYRRTNARGAVADLLGRDASGPVLLSIGRLSPEKGHADLVEALAIVAASGHRVEAVFAGDGPERLRLAERGQALGLQDTIHLPGYVAEPWRLLQETDLMVLPSHTEGLPNAALEALMMEVPVLATRVGGTPEVITDGSTGRLVEPHTPAALAAAILDFVADSGPWRRMAHAGRAMVEREFNFNLRTRKLEDFYAELVEEAQIG